MSVEPKYEKVLLKHAQEWEELALEQDRWAAYEVGRGHYGGVHVTRAAIYRRAAETLLLEAKTGIPHCAAHLLPLDRNGLGCMGAKGHSPVLANH